MDKVVNLAGDSAGDDHTAETAPELTRRAMSWIASLPEGARWLAWVHYYEPHYPYEVHDSTPSFGTEEGDRYDAEVRFVDEELGRWRRWLAADAARAARTIVVVTSDHGEQLREHGDVGHGRALWEYLIHVPLLIVVPGAAPRRVAMPASMIDIAPTIAGLVGAARDSSWSGASLVGATVLAGHADPERVVFAAERHKRLYAAITTGWKLIRDNYRNLDQLVDLAADPAEEHDASAARPEELRRLTDALIHWRERVLGTEVVE
jgi:arylsulfatase A-like enzyme